MKKCCTDNKNLQDLHIKNLNAVDSQIGGIQKRHTRYRIIKFGGSFITGILSVFLAQVTIISLIHIFLEGKANDLKVAIDTLIPNKTDGSPRQFLDDDIVTADVLFPAWDYQ
jgi:hypothetical protein